MKTILVPIDFSEQAGYALDLAVQIGKQSNAKILLLNVIEGARNFSFNTMGEAESSTGEEAFFIKKLIEQTRERLYDVKEELIKTGLEIESMVEMGNPYQSIASVVADHNAELIVMGTKGSSGLDEVLIGSNTERVVRFAVCPVITIKGKVDLGDIKKIVFATDLKEEQDEIIAEVKKMQKQLGAELHLLKVNTPNNFHTQRQSAHEFKKFIERHNFDTGHSHVYNEATEEDGILYFTEDLGSCMIAIGTHGRTGIMHLLSGSLAEDLVNHAKNPVWTMSMKK